jgi:hypothetical protein
MRGSHQFGTWQNGQTALPIFPLCGNAQLFHLTLDARQSLGGGREVDELRLNELVEVLEWFRLLHELAPKKQTDEITRTFSKTVFIMVIATSVFWTKSSSAFSTSRRACSCLAGLAFLRLRRS